MAGTSAASGPVFVVGAMRSGTTLLRLMLNEHPDVAIPAESHFVAPLLRTFGPSARLVGDDLERATVIVAGSPEWQRDFAHDEADLRAAIRTEPVTLADFLERVFRLEVGGDVARWGDKTPAYLSRVDELLACFPGAQVIAIVRDPRDVYLSLAHHGWVGDTTWEVGRYIAERGARLGHWARTIDPARYRVVRYEDLVLATEPTLRGVCDFLGLPFAPGMSAFFSRASGNVQQWELDIGAHDKLLRPPSPDDVGRWRREGSRRAHKEIEALTSDVLDAYGYEPTAPRAALGALRLSARVRHHARRPGALARRTTTRARRRLRVTAR